MIFRKKKGIDGMDREILRVLYNKGIPNIASGAHIARSVNLSPPSIKPRLVNLQNQGIIKSFNCGKPRNFTRKFGDTKVKISAPSKICWGLDLKRKK